MPKGKLLLPLLAASLALGACEDLGTDADSEARVSILLTDAPGDFRTAVVTITDIYLQPSEGEDAERVYLRQGAGITTDLLTLQNEVQALVEDRPVREGRYEQLRLVITGGYIEVENSDGSTSIFATSPDYQGLPAGARVDGELQMPSAARSGLMVRLNGGHNEDDDGAVVLTGDHALLVDFDVAQSFGKQAGQSGKWVMRPSIKAIDVQSSANLNVSLALAQGVTLPSLNGSAVTLANFGVTLTPVGGGDAKTVAFADADGNGVYEARFLYLRPGDYNVALTGPAGLTFQVNQTLPHPLTLGSGAEASVAFQLTAAAVAGS